MTGALVVACLTYLVFASRQQSVGFGALWLERVLGLFALVGV